MTRAVITIPAWYDAAQRQATKDAAQIAGLQVMRLLSEPTAAALGHGAHRGADRRYLVCDLGGGTFDVAAVDVEAGVFEVLATTGDPFLGGDDVDRAIVEHLVRDVRQTRGLDLSTDAFAIERLRLAAQRAKHELSDPPPRQVDGARARRAAVGQGRRLPAPAAPRRGRAVVLAAGQAARGAGQGSARRCGRKRDDVEEVLLVGGMTRMPAVEPRARARSPGASRA